ncbi:hypothetical protein LLEC1_05608 [Akanthomyces lecanii]|uniref:Uncharacterized protein n=1 Tax=Cordyceps confragosa TaxID=2714763 RepID=A0A179IL49_CORDF|nr:hypothetical protein LLEC1_05608 [Akanthomyces lecanii]
MAELPSFLFYGSPPFGSMRQRRTPPGISGTFRPYMHLFAGNASPTRTPCATGIRFVSFGSCVSAQMCSNYPF